MISSTVNQMWPKIRRWGRKAASNKLFPLLFALVVLTLLGKMVYDSRETLLTYEWEFRPLPLLFSFILYALALSLAVVAWGLIVNKTSGKQKWANHVRIYCVTNIAQRLPGVFWHVIGRMMMYQEAGVSKKSVSVSSGIEFVLLAISSLIVSLLTWSLLPATPLDNPLLLIAGIILGLLLIKPATVQWFMRRLKVDITHISDLHYYHIIGWLSLYVIIWGMGGIILYAIISIIYPVPVAHLPGIVAAWCLSGTIALVSTFTPSGFGLREITLSLMLSAYMPSGVAVIVTLLTRILLTLYEAVWALLAVSLLKKSTT